MRKAKMIVQAKRREAMKPKDRRSYAARRRARRLRGADLQRREERDQRFGR